MGKWVDVATESAVREYGARHYKGVIAGRLAAKAAGPIGVVLAGLALVYAAIRWVVPAVGVAAAQIAPALAVAAVTVGAFAGLMYAWHRSDWRRLPGWLRYRGITTQHVAVAALVAAVALGASSVLLWV